jgi:hypothetical protein
VILTEYPNCHQLLLAVEALAVVVTLAVEALAAVEAALTSQTFIGAPTPGGGVDGTADTRAAAPAT